MPESTHPHVELTFLQVLADLERLEEPWSEILNAGDPEEAALIIRLLMAHMGVTGKRLLGAMVLDRLDAEFIVHNDVHEARMSTGMSTDL